MMIVTNPNNHSTAQTLEGVSAPFRRDVVDAVRFKVVHLTTVHEALDTRIFHKECTSLASAGFDVTLMAVTNESFNRNGVTILPSRRDQSGNRLQRMTASLFRAYQLARKEDADLYHFHDPELIPVGLLLKAAGKKVIYDSHEHVAKQIRTKPWIPRPARVPVSIAYRVFERICSVALDGIVVADPAQVAHFPRGKVCVVENFAIAEEYERGDKSDYLERPAQVAYVGSISENRGLRQMVDAIEAVNRHHSCNLVLAGKFTSSQLLDAAKEMPGWKYVDYRGMLDRRGVYQLLSESRIGIVVLHPIPNYVLSQPVKLFEYMLAELPVVVSNFPYYKQYVDDHGSGISVDPLDIDAIADSILWLLQHPVEARAMGERGRAAVLSNYVWEQQASKLIDFYQTILHA
jgi:glycosyltransferase involved in cell wall biosynthesis